MSRVLAFRLALLLVGFCLDSTCDGDTSLGSEVIASESIGNSRSNLIHAEIHHAWYNGRSFVSDIPSGDSNSEGVQSDDPSGSALTEQSAGANSDVSTDGDNTGSVVAVGQISEGLSSSVTNRKSGGANDSMLIGAESGDPRSDAISGDTHVEAGEATSVSEVTGGQGLDNQSELTSLVQSIQSTADELVSPSNEAGVKSVVTSRSCTGDQDHSQGVGRPLILTGFIEAGNLSEARERCRVSGEPFPAHIPSYSGFFTVDKPFNSNLFFWFFPSEKNYETAPVVLWLQGGPGDSSLMGLFNELGPFSVAEDVATLVVNNNSWHRNHSLIFIDNPVGTGFSFTDSEEGYATNQSQIGNSLYEALVQFFTVFPELQKNDFYIAGTSYAGKYVPALGHFIHTRNPVAQLKINLKGIAVCSGYTDPINMVGLHEFAYQLGFIDSRVRDEMKVLEEETKQAALQGHRLEAIIRKYKTLQLFSQHSKFVYAYNLMHPKEPYEEYRFSWFLRRCEVRAHIHVGDTEFTTDEQNMTKVFEALMPENVVSARPWLEELLENQYRVLYFNGQLDITVTYPMAARMYNQLEWSGAQEYRSQDRIPWYVDGVLAGYMRSGGNFTDVVVRNAGHLVAYDQPVWALDLITRFIANTLPTTDMEP